MKPTRVSATPLDFQPGELWNYSNPGYVMLGIIIHKATGKFYGDLGRRRALSHGAGHGEVGRGSRLGKAAQPGLVRADVDAGEAQRRQGGAVRTKRIAGLYNAELAPIERKAVQIGPKILDA